MSFTITYRDGLARTGILTTGHGEIKTPVFMPVATRATVKAVGQNVLDSIGVEALLSNSYHLYLRPGGSIIQQAGGLHHFMQWHKPIITDSGGFQVYSLASSRKITWEGVFFRSHIDGSSHFFSPQQVIELQRVLGADILMAFDECPSYPCSWDYAQNSLSLTQRWWQICWEEFSKGKSLYSHPQKLFPILQGSVYLDLRKRAVEEVVNYPVEGFAIGGLSVGEPKEDMYQITEYLGKNLPEDKPRYLMGVGTPEDLIENIGRGIDMFDCVLPTRNARNGMLFTTQGIIHIKNKKWESDFSLIDKELSTFYTAICFSKAYLRHLFQVKEFIAYEMASTQNLIFYQWLIKECRKEIEKKNFIYWKQKAIRTFMQRL